MNKRGYALVSRMKERGIGGILRSPTICPSLVVSGNLSVGAVLDELEGLFPSLWRTALLPGQLLPTLAG